MKIPEIQPSLETVRLLLRPFVRSDAPAVYALIRERRVAEMLSRVPHPYPEGLAEEWIARQPEQYAERSSLNFAIVERDHHHLIGSIGLHLKPDGLRAELGFWIGTPYWGRGYCTEAGREMLRFGFMEAGLQRIHSGHFAGNEASGRVQEKLGLRCEGVQRWGASRFGELKDLVAYAIIRPDWERLQERGK